MNMNDCAKNEIEAGAVCAVTGLTNTKVGQGLGYLDDDLDTYIEPVLAYTINIPEGYDIHKTYIELSVLQEEEPSLHIRWNERS